ncbi:putative uncharacterized phage protein [Aliivibrio wodanis]|uniref:Uncharacterized phage protein n=1 Tax=Aliivibrio wodanis TaxID=80852 RepID=A0A090I6K1_9GAMM|nr:putative uncharacterized phage protein [Aliivibrio wodanis]
MNMIECTQKVEMLLDEVLKAPKTREEIEALFQKLKKELWSEKVMPTEVHIAIQKAAGKAINVGMNNVIYRDLKVFLSTEKPNQTLLLGRSL